MNPILLKPSSDTGSQVIVNGEILGQMSAVDYFAYKKKLIPEILEAYESLAEENDIIVIEGAGSPAEINLRQDDIVNMGLAELVDAPVLLAGDIDRGGVFAQLYGTTELLQPEEKVRIKGLIINKFRGDVDILRPGLTMLEEKTGIPVVGVVPYVRVDVDDEDSLAPRLTQEAASALLDVAIIRLPRISNFTDFSPLEAHPAYRIQYVSDASLLGEPDLIILPGTKSTAADLLWMRETGMEEEILSRYAAGTPVLGLCGGYQMMGRVLKDPDRVEGDQPEVPGMNLLPAETVFSAAKTRTRVNGETTGAFCPGTGLVAYEIHNGVTEVSGEPFCKIRAGEQSAYSDDGCVSGHAAGTYLHGLFDSGELTEAMAEWLCQRKGIPYVKADPHNHLLYEQDQIRLLAEEVRKSVDLSAVYGILGLEE
jgi:adenosylcobyric acid synthase